MKRFWIVGLALAVALAIAPAASADSTFDINFSASGISGNGVLTGTAVGGGQFNITSGNLTIDGFSATVIANTAANQALYGPPTGNFYFDDLIGPSTPYLTFNGILFSLSNGDFVTLWDNNPGGGPDLGDYWALFDPTPTPFGTWTPVSDGSGAPVTLNIEPAPEPSSLLLLGTGLLCMAGFLLRKAKPSMNQAA
jgi:hypothetical protein